MLLLHRLLTLLLLVWIRCTSSSSSLVSKEDVGLILYTDVSPANTSDSLQKIRDVPIKVYGNANGADYAVISYITHIIASVEFKYDSVAGRRQIGVLGQDAQRFFPESVEVY